MIHIAYCFDKNYRQHFGAAITSLLSNQNLMEMRLTVHVVTDQVDQLFLERLDYLRNAYHAEIVLYQLDEERLNLIEKLPSANYLKYLSKAAYFRFLLPDLLPLQVNKVLYLDSDTIVLGSVRPLFDIDLNEKSIGAALDAYSTHWGRLLGVKRYINSGVMLINLDYWRGHDVMLACTYFAEKNPAKIHFGDQCAINAVLQDSLVLIAAKWNVFVQSGKEQRDHEKDVVILHFIAADKPWHSWYDHSYGKYYWQYLDASPWRGVKAEQPTSVDQAEKLAMKLCKMGKYRESVVIYQNIVKILKERVRGGGSR